MITTKTFTKILFSEEAERNKAIDKMTEKSAKDLLKVIFKWVSTHWKPVNLDDIDLQLRNWNSEK